MTVTAHAALDAVQRDPREAISLAESVLAAGRRLGVAQRSTAERAIGLAQRELGDLAAALTHLDRAVQIALRGHDRHAAALARLSRAYILANTGRTAAALRTLSAALPDLHGVEAGHGRMQRGVVLNFAGRFHEAAAEYAAAVALAVEHADLIGEARARNNLGLVLATIGDPAAADTDFARAAELFTELGLDLAVVDVRWNQGIAATQAGDVPRALRILAEADAGYARLDVNRPALQLDRLELLLSVPLVDEAVELASRAVAGLRRLDMPSDLAEALLGQARAALLVGDLDTVERATTEALAYFLRQRRMSWAAFARHVRLRATHLSGERSPTLLDATVRTADRLAAVGWTTASLAARVDAARVAIELGRLPIARRQLAAAALARRRSTGVRCAQGWYAESLLRRLNGDMRGSSAALRAGLGVLDAYRAAIGAYDLRAHSGALGEALASDGLGLALDARRPAGVLAWAERGRAGALRMTPARPPEDRRLADLLGELRVVVTELRQAVQDGSPHAPLDRRRDQVEVRIRELTRQAEGPGAVARPVAVGDLGDLLGAAVLVEFIEHAGGLFVVLVRDGRASMHELGAAATISRPLRILRFALQRIATLPEAQLERSGARRAAERAAQDLDELLLRHLQRLGDRPLVLVPTGALHAMPWSVLPTCAGRTLSVAPSATAWARATGPGRDSPGRVVYVAGPDVAEAAEEVRTLADGTADAVVLDGARGTTAAVLEAFDGSALAHVAAHGQFRHDNPLFSALELVDGPLTVHDLARMRRPPRMLVLSACDLGLSAVQPGNELMGLTSALLGLGTRTVIASVLPVPSADTLTLMVDLHRRLRAGAPAPEALAAAQRQSATDAGDRAWAAAASFVCFGAA